MRHRPSNVPAIAATVGCALASAGAFLPWIYPYGGTHPLNGFQGGWLIAHLRGHFTDARPHARPFAWEWGADAWIAIALAVFALLIALANRRAVEQRYDRLQFWTGAAVVFVALYNIVLIEANSGNHLVHSDPGGDRWDALGVGLWLTLLSGIVTGAGALLGNTPEFLVDAVSGPVPIDGGRAPPA